jgi:NitT/TauT family transport system substrate-binding protein
MVSGAAVDHKRINIIFAEGTGSFVVLLEIAQAQGFFEKRGLDVRAVPQRGAAVPRLSDETPLGLIGAPAALLQVADGADLKLIATLSTTNLSGHLLAQSGINAPADLRGKRLGVRVMGAGIWISTMLALEQLQLDASRDDITMAPVGSPAEIFRALEQGAIDGALVTLSIRSLAPDHRRGNGQRKSARALAEALSFAPHAAADAAYHRQAQSAGSGHSTGAID